MLWLVVIAWWPWWGKQRGKRGASDRGMGLHTTSGQGELHKSFTERSYMSLLKILQPIVLVYLPCTTHSLHRGSTFSSNLCISHPSNIKSCPD